MEIGASLIAPKFPERTVKGRLEEARENLAEAITLILKDRRGLKIQEISN